MDMKQGESRSFAASEKRSFVASEKRSPAVGDYLNYEDAVTLMGDPDGLDGDNEVQSSQPVKYIGRFPLYDTVYRCRTPDFKGGWVDVEPWKYQGRCQKNMMTNFDPAIAPRLFIISQYAANKYGTVEQNVRFAKYIAKCMWDWGYFPIVPHLYLPQFLDDSQPFQRAWAIEAGHELMRTCDRVECWTVENYYSEGMRADMDFCANELGRKVGITYCTKAQFDRYIGDAQEEEYTVSDEGAV